MATGSPRSLLPWTPPGSRGQSGGARGRGAGYQADPIPVPDAALAPGPSIRRPRGSSGGPTARGVPRLSWRLDTRGVGFLGGHPWTEELAVTVIGRRRLRWGPAVTAEGTAERETVTWANSPRQWPSAAGRGSNQSPGGSRLPERREIPHPGARGPLRMWISFFWRRSTGGGGCAPVIRAVKDAGSAMCRRPFCGQPAVLMGVPFGGVPGSRGRGRSGRDASPTPRHGAAGAGRSSGRRSGCGPGGRARGEWRGGRGPTVILTTLSWSRYTSPGSGVACGAAG